MQDSIANEIRKLLEKIRENSKKMKAKMSKPLQNLEDVVRANIGKMQTSDAELLLLGEGKLQGLLRLSSTKKKFSEGFKKSAHTALKILLNLIDMDATPVVASAFFALDEDLYEQLRLDEHIASDEENKLDALQITRKIKLKRPFLPLKKYLPSKSAQVKFEEWMRVHFKQEVKTYAEKVEEVVEIREEATWGD